MTPDPPPTGKLISLPSISSLSFTRPESISSISGTAALSTRTMASSEVLSSTGDAASSQSLLSTSYQAKPFVLRNGRTYLSDPSLSYPFPVDLAELHRQSLRTLLLLQLFGGPVCSPAVANKPPTRVLELGCGTGFWSSMCHEHYAREGHRDIAFFGMDIAPIGQASSAGGKSRSSYASSTSHGTTSSADDKSAYGSSSNSNSNNKNNMNWTFVQHDLRRVPWPFADEDFDLIMVKDMSLAIRTDLYQMVIDECIRVLLPGGTLEMWDSDHILRMLRPHVPETSSMTAGVEDYEAALSAGAYVITPNTPLSAPLNTYLAEYNAWLSKALEVRALQSVPCTIAGAMFLQEAEDLTGMGGLRLAIPLSELKWEREGVGGVVSKDGKVYVETKGKGRDADPSRKSITQAQSALRRTALLTVVQMIQNLEPILREVSGKSQDEWDGWSGKMMHELMKENGTSWGECLEIGAWWAHKKERK